MNMPSLRARAASTTPATAAATAAAQAPSIHDAAVFERMPLAARRALLRRVYTRHAGRPLSRDALRDTAMRTARPADAVGITDAELDRASRAASHLMHHGRRGEARALFAWLASADPLCCVYTLALGTIALDEGAHDEAERWFSAAIDCFGGDLGAHAGRAIARFHLHGGHEGGREDGYVRDVEAALELDPEATHALTVRMAQTFTEGAQSPRARR